MQKGSFLLEKHYITLITSGMYLLQQAASLDFLRVYKGVNFRFRSQTCEIVVDDELLCISWARHGFFFASIQLIILSNILVNSKMRKKYLTKIGIVYNTSFNIRSLTSFTGYSMSSCSQNIHSVYCCFYIFGKIRLVFLEYRN